MILTQQTIIKQSNMYYNLLDIYCYKAKNLYNVVLYHLRDAYFNYDAFMNYYSIDKVLKKSNNVDYRNMPLAHSAQGTIKQVCETWKAFWQASKDYHVNPSKYFGCPKLPKYLHKTNGRAPVYLTNQNVKLKEGSLKFPKSFNGFTIPFEQAGKIKQVRIVPRSRHFIVEVVYEIPDKQLKPDNKKYLGVDLGIDNFATIVSNDGSQPILLNGKGLKSLNKHWNKRLAHIRSVTAHMNKTNKVTKLQVAITNKRNRVIKDYCHKASKYIVDLAISRGCNSIIVGRNVGWKQDSKLNKRVNQSFIQIPHALFLEMLSYKCALVGINYIETEESYTSKTSWLDNELPMKHQNYQGNRVHRGLFISSTNEVINADVNGALQIVRKVVPNAKTEGIWGYANPIRVDVI